MKRSMTESGHNLKRISGMAESCGAIDWLRPSWCTALSSIQSGMLPFGVLCALPRMRAMEMVSRCLD